MSRAEYKEISPRLDQERNVLLSPGAYNRTLQMAALYDPNTPLNLEKMENYPSADYGKLLEKFHASLPKRDNTHPVITLNLSVDEQNYLLEMYSERIRRAIFEKDMNLAHNLLSFEARFKNRCDISNRQLQLPVNIYKLGPHTIPDITNGKTE